MLLRYGVLSLIAVAVLVIVKIWLFPYLLHRLFPESDTGALVYEMLVLSLGGVTLVLYMFLGHYGKYRAYLSRRAQMGVVLFLQAPFFLHGWLKMQEIAPQKYTLLYSFAEGWCSLLAEPIRLLFFVYPWTDAIAVLASFTLVLLGRFIRSEETAFFYFIPERKQTDGGR
ncbi:hypothetical protein [Aneurinibacillus sp. REN35]|uniref:hypothetical protein n=1 Tax=Aneurinibacillus sp. REN35 TaxID=3237286 RepID=UPI00352747EE